MSKYTISFIMSFSLCMIAKAQVFEDFSSIRTDLNYRFENLDKSRIPTGLLEDYAIDLVDLHQFDGANMSDSSLVNFTTFEQILRSLRSSAPLTAPFNDVSTIIDSLSVFHNNTSTIPIGTVVYRYNYIREDALLNQLVNYSFSTGQVSDRFIGETWVNPYDEEKIVAFSPYMNVVYSPGVTFSFPSNMVFSNLTINSIQFDAGDGFGFRTVQNENLTINYPCAGTYELKMKVQLLENNSYQELNAHSMIHVLYDSDTHMQPQAIFGFQPDSTHTFTASQSYSGYQPTARVSVLYSNSQFLLEKPFIIAEGFDPIPWNSLYYSESYYYDKGATNLYNVYSQNGTTLFNYDVVYVDWDDSSAPIQANADIMAQVIRWVNSKKTSQSESTILMGQSMGGLISRVALCNMESIGELHDVGLFISHDSPHLGANVPLGYLYAAQYLLNLFDSDLLSWAFNRIIDNLSNEIDRFVLLDSKNRIYALRESPAVKQMLINYISPEMILDNSIHEQWQSYLNNIGFPQGDGVTPFRKVSISNAGNNLKSYCQNYASLDAEMTVGWLIYSFVGAFSFATTRNPLSLLYLLPQHSKLAYSIRVRPNSSPNKEVFNYSLSYTKTFFWRLPITITLDNGSYRSPNSSISIDAAKSSYFAIPTDEQDSSLSDGIHEGSFSITDQPSNIGDVSLAYCVQDTIPFIPAVSSIAYGNNLSGNSINNYFTYNTDYINQVPFDAYYMRTQNTEHIALDDDMLNWAINVRNLDIQGPSLAQTGTVFSVSGGLFPSSWMVSPADVASITGSGQLTIKNPRTSNITVSCKGLYGGQPYKLQKTFHINRYAYTYYLTSRCETLITPADTVNYTVFAHRIMQEITESLPEDASEIMFGDHPIPDTLGIDFPIEPILELPRYIWKIYDPSLHCTIRTDYSDSTNYYVSVPENCSYVIYFTDNEGEDGFNTSSIICDNLPLEEWVLESVMVNEDGLLYVGEDADPIEVKSNTNTQTVTYVFPEASLTYTACPSDATVLRALLSHDYFLSQVKELKPWGSRDYLMIPYTLVDNNTGLSREESLKIIIKR